MLDITPKLSLFYGRIVFAYFCLSMVLSQHEVRVDKSRLATLVPSWIYSVWEHRSHRERLYDQIWAHIMLLLLTPEKPWSIDPIKETADCSISFERGIIIIGANILQKRRRERATTERERSDHSYERSKSPHFGTEWHTSKNTSRCSLLKFSTSKFSQRFLRNLSASKVF